MQDVQCVLTGWFPRSSKTGKAYWECVFEGGQLLQPTKATTFNQGLAMKAMSLHGVQGITARLKQNGDWLNLEDISGPGEQLPMIAPQAGQPLQQGLGQPMGMPQQGLQMGGGQIGGAMPQQAIGVDPREAERKATNERIGKQEALGHASLLVGQLYQGAGAEAVEEAVEQALEVAKAYYNAVVGTVAAPVQQTPETPEEVAAQVPGVQVGAENIATPEAPEETTPSWV